MMKTLAALLTTLGILTTAGIASADHGPRGVVVVHDNRGPRRAPPEGRMERVRERRGYVWAGGNYRYHHGRYHWNRGRYMRERQGYQYAPGRWETREDRYVWAPATWQITVR